MMKKKIPPEKNVEVKESPSGDFMSRKVREALSKPIEENIQIHPLPGITGITVKGFKSIVEETKIEIRPLTLLAGANSSGKSSIMQPLLLMKQTLEAGYDPGPLLLDGPNVQFTSYDQMASRQPDGSSSLEFSIGVGCEGHDLTLTFAGGVQGSIDLERMDVSAGGGKRSFWKGMSKDEAWPRMGRQLRAPDSPEVLVPVHATIPPGLYRDRCFFRLQGEGIYSRSLVPAGLPQEIAGMIHVRGLRGNPQRSYPRSGTGPQFPGTFENYVAAIIHSWQEEKDPRLHEVENALKVLGLGRKVHARLLDAAHIELLVNRLPRASKRRKEDMVSIADVGFGVSQVLPVLVSLFAAVPGQLVYIEQPELHLHPRAQVGLASLLADAAKRGVRVVAETHSSLLLLAVQTLVAKDELDPNLVKLHWFQRGEDGITKVRSADLDDKGAFGDWPEDFGEVELEAQRHYLDAAQTRRSKR